MNFMNGKISKQKNFLVLVINDFIIYFLEDVQFQINSKRHF